MMNIKLNGYLLILLIGLLGCAFTPSVKYPVNAKANPSELTQYQLARGAMNVSWFFVAAGVILGFTKIVTDGITTGRSEQ